MAPGIGIEAFGELIVFLIVVVGPHELLVVFVDLEGEEVDWPHAVLPVKTKKGLTLSVALMSSAYLPSLRAICISHSATSKFPCLNAKCKGVWPLARSAQNGNYLPEGPARVISVSKISNNVMSTLPAIESEFLRRRSLATRG